MNAFPRISIAVVVVVALLLVAGAACKQETPVERAERLCLKQERAKVAKDASADMKELHDLGAKAICSAGPAMCEILPDSQGCTDFIAKYR